LKGDRQGQPGLHLPAAPAGPRRLTIVGGGTAGHVYPALTIADTYRRTFDHVEVRFIGTPEGCEARLVPAHGYRFTLVQGTPWFGVGMRGRLHAVRSLVVGIAQARRLLRAQGAKLVIGLGGYASAGVLLAAWSLGIQTVIHEANIVPGLANKLLGRLADRVYLGFQAARWAFSPDRTLVTGNPVRPEITAVGNEKLRATHRLRRTRRILVTGGSQGAPFLNRHVPALLRQVAGQGLALEVWHQVGDDNPEPVRARYARAHIAASVMPYIADMADAYRWADFAIARSGSGTLAELAACGLPALLVPLPTAAGDHQTVNAIAFAEAGGGWWSREAGWQAQAQAARLASVLRDANTLNGMAERARRLATPEAAAVLVSDCEALMAGQW
jgi:UDP-N-acetylglucosamine--N-acetylmuramyl-(pentapeptide) pyrophosphoryl-undecaprenol N-acetylglucosamine transferase